MSTATVKACRACGETKPLDDFYRHATGRDGHRNECKRCRCAKSSQYRRDNYEQVRADTERRRTTVREYVRSVKVGRPCADCGGSWLPHVMDFHHIEKKDQLVSRIVSSGLPLERVKAEIAKCVLLCANCHRLRHGPPTWKRA